MQSLSENTVYQLTGLFPMARHLTEMFNDPGCSSVNSVGDQAGPNLPTLRRRIGERSSKNGLGCPSGGIFRFPDRAAADVLGDDHRLDAAEHGQSRPQAFTFRSPAGI
jgi:hypothetical protein